MSTAERSHPRSRIAGAIPGPAKRDKGFVLLISLIVLVAMSLAGVAMLRSVDTGSVVAGNMAFKQSAIMTADVGTAAAVNWLETNSSGAYLQNSHTASGYYSSRPVVEPDWFDADSWTVSVWVNGGTPDASGNRVRYIIHRMCTLPDTAYNGSIGAQGNQCALYYASSAAASGGSMSVGSPQFIGTPMIYYRVTTRVEGPRNTVSVVQTSVLLSI